VFFCEGRKAQENLYSYSYAKTRKNHWIIVGFKHFYKVQKFGASPIEEAMLTVNIPMHFRWHNAEDVAISNIIGIMDEYQFNCSDSNQTEALSSRLTKSMDDVIRVINSSNNNTHAKFSIDEDTPMNVPSGNRTLYINRILYINCTSNAIKCVQITCRLDPFQGEHKSQSNVNWCHLMSYWLNYDEKMSCFSHHSIWRQITSNWHYFDFLFSLEFLSSLSVAKFLVTLDLRLSSFLGKYCQTTLDLHNRKI